MKLYYSKIFLACLIFLIVFFIAGFIVKLPLWIAILLFVPVMEFTFHEYVHAFVAWLYGVKTEYITFEFFKLCCVFETLPNKYPNRNQIYANITLSGSLFQTAIYSFEITFLILSGLALQINLPFFFAGALLFCYVYYDILNKECDFRRVFTWAMRNS